MFGKLINVIGVIGIMTMFMITSSFAQVPDKVIAGSQVVIPIALTSSDVSAMNFDLIYDASKLEIISVSAGSALTNKSVDFNKVAEGTVKGIIYSIDSTVMASGEILNVLVEVKTTTYGQVSLSFSNVVSAKANATAGSIIAIPTVSFTVVVDGDVNNDGFVNSVDIVIVSKYIIGLNPNNYTIDAVDINKDSTVDVRDLRILINKVLGQ
jgi:uracil phosphoribosyltransferase